MKRLAKRLGSTMTLGAVLLWAAQASATQALYSNNCTGCHSQTVVTCNGCHAHGDHSNSAKTDINVSGTTDKTSYAPGETVKVTINGGYRNGWLRVILFDQNLKELARSSCPGGQGGCTTSVFPVTLTAPAPTAAGTYLWATAWYGHQYEASGASFGSGNSSALKVGFFTPDVNNSNHGYQTVALPAFTVSAATGPAIALNPTSLNFQTVTVGQSKALSSQVRNTGTATLNVTGISSCSGTPGSVTWMPTGSFTVAAGGIASLNVTFAPTAVGALPTGSCVRIASNDPAKPTIDLGVSGTGASTTAPAIALNPTSLNFQTVTVGQPKALSAQVRNTGTATLNVTGISSCSGTPGSVTWMPAGSFTVAAGGSASLTVTFAPTSAGALPAGSCVRIASSDPAKPTIDLGVSGTGASTTGPAIALNPTSLNFQTVTVGHSKMLSAQVQNTGTATLNVTGISSCSGTPGSVTWMPTGSFTVAAGGIASLNVTFAPTAVGALPTGSCVRIASNDPTKPTIDLGVGGIATIAHVPAITLVPASLDFETVTVGSSKALSTEVENTGNAPLDVTSIALCSGTPASVTWNATVPASVAAGASVTLTVVYAPTAAAALPAATCLKIASNDPAQATVELAVKGTGSTTNLPPFGCTTGGRTESFCGLALLIMLAAGRRLRRRQPRAG